MQKSEKMEKSQCKKICILVASLPPCWMKLEAICTYDTLAKLPKCTYEKPSLAQNRLLEFWKKNLNLKEREEELKKVEQKIQSITH